MFRRILLYLVLAFQPLAAPAVAGNNDCYGQFNCSHPGDLQGREFAQRESEYSRQKASDDSNTLWIVVAIVIAGALIGGGVVWSVKQNKTPAQDVPKE